jgi:hypothetical protein
MNLPIFTDGFAQGTLQEDPDGREARVLLSLADPTAFYACVIEKFRCSDYAHTHRRGLR